MSYFIASLNNTQCYVHAPDDASALLAQHCTRPSSVKQPKELNQTGLFFGEVIRAWSYALKVQIGFSPSSIYSCSIGHIWEHVFCHLGCWAVKRKFLKRRNFCLSMLLFGVVFSCFHGQKFNFSIFFSHYSVRTKKLHKIKLNFFLKNS